jgi:hypothetical protein
MQCEEDWAVMHALHQGHGWSISRIAREFDVTWRTARRYATAATVPRYRPRARPAELSQAQAAHVVRRLGAIPNCGPRRCTGRSNSSATPVPIPRLPAVFACCAQSMPRPIPRSALRPTPASRCRPTGPTAASGWSANSCAPCRLRRRLGVLPDGGGALCHRYHPPHDAAAAGRVPGRPWRGTHRGPHRPGSRAGDRLHAVRAAGVCPRVGRSGRGARPAPSACRPYRAKTKGKVERVIRELKQDFLAWVTGQPMPPSPMLADYDRLAAQWCTQVVATRRHRTTGRVVQEAWSAERSLLRQIPDRVLASRRGGGVQDPARLIDLRALRNVGDVVAAPSLGDYEAVLG